MTPERWQQIKDLLATALEISPAERANYLDQSCRGDDLLRREVEILLQRESAVSSRFLDRRDLEQVAAAVLTEEANPWIGRRVGAYQIVEQIGAGGMGEVYRAFRADDQYRMDVALKVVRAGQDSATVITRFRNERQILASLEHPNIARLLDGGTTESGTPYLVMELIEGRPIAEYCDARKLSIPDRLKLFVQVCGAVQFAHQRLIIHRDIKPTNILVTSDGTPKLLDFGIAKVLGSDIQLQRNETLTAFRILTPEYASPEQINGEPVTTASDVYSLGVVLYDLLTGRSPYPATARTSQELVAAIAYREPEKPSTLVVRASDANAGAPDSAERIASARSCTVQKLQKQLNGDLDNIVLLALRKESGRRYASTEQFAADIRRHLEGVPVLARKDTAGYRMSKFVGRHKVGVAASAVVLIAIVGALAVSLYEAHVARQQTEIARTQKIRAERRFNDVRNLANSLMFEIHDSIKDLPGSTSARKILVTRAQEYLDSLSQEAGGDAALQRELAAAYDRVGDLLGYDGAANLGNFSQAIQSYKKALAIRESLAAANPSDPKIQTELFNNYFRLSFALQNASDFAGALSNVKKALPLAQTLASTSNDPKFQDGLAGVHWQMANILRKSADFAGALEEYRISASMREPLAREPSATAVIRTHLASDYDGLAQMLWRTGDTEQALEKSRKAVRILEELSAANPNDATLREYLGEAYSFQQPILQQRRELDESLRAGRKAQQIFGELAQKDPSNWLASANLGSTEIGIGETLILRGRIQEAIPHVRYGMNLFESRQHKSSYDLAGQAQSYSTLAMAEEKLADRESSSVKKAEHLREARAWLQKSVQIWEQDPKRGSPDPMGGREGDRVREELAKCNSALAKL